MIEPDPAGDPDDEIAALARPATGFDRIRERFFPRAGFELARFAILRLLGVVYGFAFLGLFLQAVPLFGEPGLTPAVDELARVAATGGGMRELPTIFWWDASDTALRSAALVGLGLSCLVSVGFANAPILALLVLLYGSFVRIGGVWYGYGWELQLLETGFLAIFLAEPLDPRPFPRHPTPFVVLVLFRWLAFRIFLGAGLIKLRGDACWLDATCLDHHFETQPLPNPLSQWFHAAPHGIHVAGVWFNHAVELVAPFFVFGPRPARRIAGVAMIAFQLVLILSGNLSFLNWLTILPVLACFDDDLLVRLLPGRLRERFEARTIEPLATAERRVVAGAYAALVALLSIDPVLNLLAERQVMNRAYTTLELVNTYGAFGSVGEERHELVLEGTLDDPEGDARWLAYELPCKPGDPARRLCVLGPYQPRLDWQIWFAAMGDPGDSPWMLHLVAKLLAHDEPVRTLFARDPFGGRPPRAIRVLRYRYAFAPFGSGRVWDRSEPTIWLPPLTADDPRLVDFLERAGFRPRSGR